ncbi:hypothetical protein WN51_12707 [Melipona quadrifasciata]|uniref:Uncharacterized protein n=1 Tax=Melipona quadrifasciata TaxID=166423 RepID=A0A0N0BGT3_9HYME|nr:hypothetical protein WN51_12707 [Melipona quadrifasciata]
MAGKPEQPSTHSALPNHSHLHHHRHHHHHHHHHHQQQQQQQQHHHHHHHHNRQQQQQQPQQQQQQQQQEQQNPQHVQEIQQNSVLVYVSGENFAYATAVGQNAAAAAAAATAVGYQSPQQATYAGILPPQVATAAATFPAKTAIYCNDNNSATVAAVNNCCRLKPAGEYASTDGESSRSARSMSNSNTEDEEDYGTSIVSNNGLLYRQTQTTTTTTTATAATAAAAVTVTAATNLIQTTGPSENDTASAESNSVEQLAIGKVTNTAGDMLANKLFPSRIHGGEIYPSGARLVADAGYSNTGGQMTAQSNLGEGCVGLLTDDACVAYVRQANEPSQASAVVFQGDGVEQRVNMDDKSRQQDGFDNQTGSSLSSSGSNVGGGGSVVVIGSGGSVATSCDSVRSDTGESSTYSSLSSPESQSQSAHDGLPVANSGAKIGISMSEKTRDQLWRRDASALVVERSKSIPRNDLPRRKKALLRGVIVYNVSNLVKTRNGPYTWTGTSHGVCRALANNAPLPAIPNNPSSPGQSFSSTSDHDLSNYIYIKVKVKVKVKDNPMARDLCSMLNTPNHRYVTKIAQSPTCSGTQIFCYTNEEHTLHVLVGFCFLYHEIKDAEIYEMQEIVQQSFSKKFRSQLPRDKMMENLQLFADPHILEYFKATNKEKTAPLAPCNLSLKRRQTTTIGEDV